MNTFWLLLVVPVSVCISDHDPTKIRVFPALNRSIAGVFQVSYVNKWNQVDYAFNASVARSLCLSLGVNIASKAQVQQALRRGLETCRFGWTDENLAVIPRIRPQFNCGQNQTGLVNWRADVTKKFDVFCFNESDSAALLDTTTQHPPASSQSSLHRVSSTTSQPLFFTHMESEAEKALVVGSAQGTSGKKTVAITSVVAIFLVAVVTVVYIKMKRRNSDKEPYIETEEWTTQAKYTGPKKSCSANVEDISV